MKQSPTHSPVRTLRNVSLFRDKWKQNIPFIDISNNLKSFLDTIILDLSGLNSSSILFSKKPQNIEGIITSN